MVKNIQKLYIEFTTLFNKQLTAAPDEVKAAFLETLHFFKEDQDNPALRKHFLKQKFAGYQSIDITNDYRAIFIEKQTGEKIFIRFYMLGTHKELYG